MICIYICMYICMCIYMYVYILTHLFIAFCKNIFFKVLCKFISALLLVGSRLCFYIFKWNTYMISLLTYLLTDWLPCLLASLLTPSLLASFLTYLLAFLLTYFNPHSLGSPHYEALAKCSSDTLILKISRHYIS